MATTGQGRGRRLRGVAATAFALALAIPSEVVAQALDRGLGPLAPPRPPAPIPLPSPSSANLAPGGGVTGPPTSLLPEKLTAPQSALAPATGQPPAGAPATLQSGPVIPPGQVALALSARFARDPPAITGGLLWRIYADKLDASGTFRLIKEDRTASPTIVLPAGGYLVHVTFGLASAVKRVQLRSETVREVFEIAAGGARFEGRVGDSKIPAGQISFDVYRGSQFEPGEKRPAAKEIATGDIVLLPEGTYYVVSNYGDGNAVVRSDIRVQAGKLTDVTINHRAAVITLKLVGEAGGEALANTQWSVLTPGGDVVKESIGAFPKVILAEGDYIVIARNEGEAFKGEFKVEPGFDREIEVLAHASKQAKSAQ
jgi:hypothetical protein